MKFFLLLVFVVSGCFSIAQSEPKSCHMELSKNEITSGRLKENCALLKNIESISYKVKIPRKQTVALTGDLISDKAIDYISNARIGDSVVIFDIKTEESKTLPPLVITLL